MEPQAAGRCFHELREIHWVARVAHLYVTVDGKQSDRDDWYRFSDDGNFKTPWYIAV